jgi:hypothetical protein
MLRLALAYCTRKLLVFEEERRSDVVLKTMDALFS